MVEKPDESPTVIPSELPLIYHVSSEMLKERSGGSAYLLIVSALIVLTFYVL
jgi:hypothetical protein